jgi:hypothetical protein
MAVPLGKKKLDVYLCCSDLADRLKTKDVLLVEPKHQHSKEIRYQINDFFVRFCPFCGWKLQLAKEFAKQSELSVKKRAESVLHKRRLRRAGLEAPSSVQTSEKEAERTREEDQRNPGS